MSFVSRKTSRGIETRYVHKVYKTEVMMNQADYLPGLLEFRQATDIVQVLHFWAGRMPLEQACERTLREFNKNTTPL